MIEIEDYWDPKGSIGLIAKGDEPKKPIVTLNPIVVQIQPSEGDVVNVSVPLKFEAPPSKEPKPIELEFGVPRAPTSFEVTVLPPKAPIPVFMTDVTPFKTNVIPWDYTVEAGRKGKTYTGEAIVAQGMTRTGRVYTPEHLAESSKQDSGRAVETRPDDLWRKVQAKEYSVVEQLNKTPAQISILALLQSSETHKKALIKVLSEAYVPSNITGGKIANMVGQVLESHKITFHEDELPPEGLGHNKALHITAQCEDHFVTRILVDGGSSLNICLLVTLWTLGKGLHEIKDGAIGVKAFDGSQRSTIGEISLCLQMGPTWFDVEFQVIDISASYNLLLGRPWILAVGAVASTLHQAVKFEWNHQEVIIHGDGINPIYSRQAIPMIGGRRKIGGETYHHIERVNAIDKDKWWDNKIESILNWSGYEPGKGLGKNLQGITKPINLKKHVRQTDIDSEEDEIPEEVVKEVKNFENRPKSNLDETEVINLGNAENVKETRISVHLSPSEKEEYKEILIEYEDIFTWSYDDMTGLSTSIVPHKLPTDPACPPVKQKLRKFKPDMSLKIKEEVTKQVKARVLRVVEYPTWLANVVSVPKKDGKVRVCIDYRDLNRASPKDDFPLPNIHILIDNCVRHELQSFVDCFAGYHQIWMDEEDAEKTAFIMPWGMKAADHMGDLRKFFNRLRRYDLKLNPAKCAFGVPAGKLLGFVVSRRGIELDPSKVKVIQELPPPKNKKDVMSFLGRLNYISRFIAQSTVICEPIFKMLKKDAATKWTNDCQKAFDRIKEYLSTPPILVPPEPGRPLLLYLAVLDGAFGYELRKRFRKTEFQHIPRVQNEFADALATLSSMIQHPDTNFIDPIQVKIHDQTAYCAHVEEEADGKPWFHDIRKYLTTGEYPELPNATQKRTLRRLSNNFFHSGGILYRRTPDMGLLTCVEAREATKILEEVHAGTCGPHMNGFVLAKKILRPGYFWMTMEADCIQYVRRCHHFQIHADMIKVPPNELTATSSPWSFAAWGMDVIGPIESATSNGHRFILVAID
ncbi:uncharacterized protein [Nicotiana sylvestris]|uniref:uncharacterized protein n=1 Tax=Nicotiana sylvestris TaxID=4096 RepID=UPI00388C63EC